MGTTYSATYAADLWAVGSTPDLAIERLMAKIGVGNYSFSFGTGLNYDETTPGLFETNIVVVGALGARRRAQINQLLGARGTYYRAYFGELA